MLALAPRMACADPGVAVRVGDHPGFGRIVFDLPPGARADAVARDNVVTVSFEGGQPPASPGVGARNLVAMRSDGQAMTLVASPGARPRVWRAEGKLVVDLADATPRATGSRAAPVDVAPVVAGPADASASAPNPPSGTTTGRRSDTVRRGAGLTLDPTKAAYRGRETASDSVHDAAEPRLPGDGTARLSGDNTPRSPNDGAARQAGRGPSGAERPTERAAPAGPQRRAGPPAPSSQGAQTAQAAQTPKPRGSTRQAGTIREPQRPLTAQPLSRSDEAPIAAPASVVAVARDPDPPPVPTELQAPREPAPARAPAIAAGEASEPGAIAASRRDDGDQGPRILLPFAAMTGAAAYRSGEFGVVVFDERRPIDLAALRDDPRFATATVRLLTNATMLRMPLDARQQLRLARSREGWLVALEASDKGRTALAPIGQSVVAGSLRLQAKATGGVVVVPEETTGATLLVGTQRESGQAVALSRRMPAFGLRASWQGVVVEPVTDALTLRTAPEGFVVSADAQGLPLAPEDAETLTRLDAGEFSRRFDFGSGSSIDLRRRLEQAVATAAADPPRSRLRSRLDVAVAMLGLGLGVEAQALLQVAGADDPRAADDPDAIALGAIAATLAGRAEETKGIDDARLDGTDDVALWRGLRGVCCGGEASAQAAALAAQLPLIRSFPSPLRKRLLPLALQAMARGGEHAAVLRVLAQPQQDAATELARAIALDAAARAGGDVDAALAAYDRLASGNDRLTRARALWRAVELRLAKGRLAPAQAADALERQSYAWREEARERALRLRIAELRAQSGDWPRALATLREGEKLWPEQSATFRERMRTMFADAVTSDERTPLPALEMVALVEENADLLPSGDAGRRLAAELSDRLLSLDLPTRARAVLEKLLSATPPGGARAEIADRLVGLLLRERDPDAALAALAGSEAEGLAPTLRERRGLAQARAYAAKGETAKAVAALADLDSDAAEEARARIAEQSKDWPAALAALNRYVPRVLPANGGLNDAQAALVLRLASVAAQVGDDAVLARLRNDLGPRMPRGSFADLATILTGQRLGGVADLPILAREVALARRLPDALKSWPAPVAAR